MTTLLVASAGGHLTQLHRLRRHIVDPASPVVWVTFDSPQSRSLLAGEQVHYLPYVAPRDWRAIARAAAEVPGIVRRHGVTQVWSTGSGVALAVLPVARAMGAACHYVESAARSLGPSLTGRVLAGVPGVRTSCQYDSWASPRWPRFRSVFDDFVVDRPVAEAEVGRVVVSLGTIDGYGFRSLLQRLLEIAPADVEFFWQTGNTDVSGLVLDARPMVPHADLVARLRDADVVVTHAGIGSALDCLDSGRVPVLVPRRAARGEHVDDHQAQIAGELDALGLALHREVEQLTWEDLLTAARLRVRPS